MEIWLRHPQHGVKVAYHPGEAEADEKNGWQRFDPRAEASPKRPILTLPKRDGGKAA